MEDDDKDELCNLNYADDCNSLKDDGINGGGDGDDNIRMMIDIHSQLSL